MLLLSCLHIILAHYCTCHRGCQTCCLLGLPMFIGEALGLFQLESGLLEEPFSNLAAPLHSRRTQRSCVAPCPLRPQLNVLQGEHLDLECCWMPCAAPAHHHDMSGVRHCDMVQEVLADQTATSK